MAEISVDQLVIAGWTGRDEAALKKHIRELEEIGVKPPKTTPIFYRVSSDLLTQATEIQVSGPDTSGEVEFVLVSKPDGLSVHVGSDHTDRKAETVGVKPHWEKLVLRSWTDGELYQEGPVTAMRSPEDLLSRYPLKQGWAMFCSTLAAKGGIRPGKMFRMELEDPVRKKKLTHEYRIDVLPVEG
jgi:hypothetical protein